MSSRAPIPEPPAIDLDAVARRFRLPIANIADVSPQAVALVPERWARRFHVLPISATEHELVIATADPLDVDCERTLAFATGRRVQLAIAERSVIGRRIEELYGGTSQAIEAERAIDVQHLAADVEAAPSVALDDGGASISALVDELLAAGIGGRASDIHIEPEEQGIAVRHRVDGVLGVVRVLPRAVAPALVSRIKILSGLDIADRLRPQDGRARVAVNGVPVDLRVSTLPASLGEKVVIRILDSRATVLSLESLGLNQDEHDAFKALLTHHEGVVLVTGPTGSGKTTTLYSAIRSIQTGKTNIVTVEDPVEYRLQGIVQVQVHEKAGLTFASALRSILRQDPDVVLVGEIRDKETAQIAIQASLTGHLVLSTLHTNDAPNAVTRLVDIGIEPYKIAASLRGVVAQRLMRRLCPSCKEVWVESVPEKAARWVPQGTPLYRAVGCPECAGTGYRGRFSIVEVLTITPEVERVIGSGATADKIAEAGRGSGLRSLWESGIAHVLRGESSLDELVRVVDVPFEGEQPAEEAVAPQGSAAEQAAPRREAARASQPGTAAPPERPPVLPQSGVDAFELLDHMDAVPAVSRIKRKVLLVDDEDALRRVMKDLLEREGYTVAEARDGVQALDQVDRFGPEVIVLDLNLPGLDGYGVLSHLRSRPATAGIPVVVLTAKSDEDNEVRVFQLGADDFLTKPFRARALSARLDAVLGRRRFTA